MILRIRMDTGAEIIRLPPISYIDSLTFWNCTNIKCVYVPFSVVYITPDAFDEHKGILIKCYAGSYCEEYCIRHNLKGASDLIRTTKMVSNMV